MSNCTACSVKFSDYYSENIYTWCTNCGNYGIAAATKRALIKTNKKPKDTVMCFDIGCNGNGSDKIHGYRLHGLHGRVISVASGAALANNKITVIASGGDGATLSEGINHLIHAVRSDYNITFLLHNNSNYGLTKGQASSTTPSGLTMNSTPDGRPSDILHVMNFVLNLNPSFAARGFAGDVDGLTDIIASGIEHKGFSFIEILQPCPSYNKSTPHEWYQDRVYDVVTLPDYNNTNLKQAQEVGGDIQERIATGILYQDKNRYDFYNRLINRKDKEAELVDEVEEHDISELLLNYR